MNRMQKLFLAIDAGTSAVKTCLIDDAGRQVAVHVEEYATERPSPDRAEIDVEIYWRATTLAIRSVLNHATVRAADVVAVGVTSQGETLIVLDKDGRPLRKAIVWTDNRAVSEAQAIAGVFDIDEVYRITGQQEITPCWTATKLLWLRGHEPTVFRATAKFLLVADYLIFKLTGRYVTDHALNPSTLYYDLTRGRWWQPMLDLLGITESQLPELTFSGIPVGGVTADVGLRAGTIVVTVPIDQVAGALGAGNMAPGMVTETTGSALAICATYDQPVYDPRRRIGLYRHATETAYVLMPWVPAAGLVFRWFRDVFGGGLSYEELAREAGAVSPGADGLMLLSHLNGAFCPDHQPGARGVFYGVTLAHRRAHFVRALFESVAFLLRDNLELLKSLGVAVQTVCSIGGGARSDLWLQIKADVLNAEVTTIAAEEATGLGVAMLAAVGAGVYPDIPTAVRAMVRLDRTFAPNAETAAHYASIFRNYRRLNALLLPTFGGTS